MGIPWEWEKSIIRRNLNGNGKHPAWEWKLPRLLWEFIPTDDCIVAEISVLCKLQIRYMHYTPCSKNPSPQTLAVTLSNLNRF